MKRASLSLSAMGQVMQTRIITAQDVEFFESRISPAPMVGLAFEFPSGGSVEPHVHPYGQVLFGGEGIMCVDTPRGTWVVPPQRAVWIPPMTLHAVRLRASFGMHNLLISPHAVADLPKTCEPLVVSNLMRELILRAASTEEPLLRKRHVDKFFEIIRDELEFIDEMPLSLEIPRERRLARLCTEFLREPSDNRTLQEWGDHVGASARTLSRLFTRELNLTFDEWRRHVRLQEALYRLAEGRAVSAVANELGYESTTGFIEMFRKSLGRTPGQYFA